MKIDKMRCTMKSHGYNVDAVSIGIGMNRATFYRKLQRGGDFSVEEACKISEFLMLSDLERAEIFLSR